MAAVVAVLVLRASAAHGQAGAPASVPAPEPRPEFKLVLPDAAYEAVDPDPRPARATPPAPDPEELPEQLPAPLKLAAPRMVHERRSGLVTAGGIVLGTTYGLQLLVALTVSLSGIDQEGGCSSCSNQAGILLLPIIGPVVVSLDPPGQGAASLAIGFTFAGLEAAGAAMLIVGLIGHDVPQAPRPYGRIALLPFVTPQTEGLTMSMRW